jgi:preprotein translocase subunit Sec63
MGIDLSQIPNLVGQHDGFDPYRVLGLEKTVTDGEVKKRYRELLIKLHPDTAGVKGTDFLLQMMIAAYQEIAKERGWH